MLFSLSFLVFPLSGFPITLSSHNYSLLSFSSSREGVPFLFYFFMAYGAFIALVNRSNRAEYLVLTSFRRQGTKMKSNQMEHYFRI